MMHLTVDMGWLTMADAVLLFIFLVVWLITWLLGLIRKAPPPSQP